MDNQFMNSGEVAIIDSTTIEISELPVKTWTQVSRFKLKTRLVEVFFPQNVEFVLLNFVRHVLGLQGERSGADVERNREGSSSDHRLQGLSHRHQGPLRHQDV